MSEHTKGPWRYYGTNAFAVVASANTENDVVICHLNDEANARLIAAAPELLNVCKFLLSAMRKEFQTRGLHSCMTVEWIESQKQAENIIAKAEETQ